MKRYMLTISVNIKDPRYPYDNQNHEAIEKYIKDGSLHLLSNDMSELSPKAARVISLQLMQDE